MQKCENYEIFEISDFQRKALCAVLGPNAQHGYRVLATSLSKERDMTFSNFRWRCIGGWPTGLGTT